MKDIFDKEVLKMLADEQYELGTNIVGEKRIMDILFRKDYITALRSFSQAETLYRQAGEELMANLCLSNIRGLAPSKKEMDNSWLAGYTDVQNMIKNIRTTQSSIEESL